MFLGPHKAANNHPLEPFASKTSPQPEPPKLTKQRTCLTFARGEYGFLAEYDF